MNHFVCTLSLILCFSCRGQQNRQAENLIDTTYTINVKEIIEDNNKTWVEFHLSKYIDSLNNAMLEAELPHFLLDSQFDYTNRFLWGNSHIPISVRAQLINRVSNCKPLRLVVLSNNENFKKKPIIEKGFDVPLSDLSFYDIILNRMHTLECGQ